MSKKVNKAKKPEQHGNHSGLSSEVWKLNTRQLLSLSAAVAAAYFGYSMIPHGFYQHDEVAHFFNMLDFWNNPNVILGNWAKPGYKLLFVVPALLGNQVVAAINCIIAAAACAIAYKVAEQLGSKIPLAAFFFLASQPIWVQLSFRNYSEPISAFLLLLSIFLSLRGKFEVTALVLSYSTTIRQEFLIIAVCFGLYLLFQKKYLALLSLLVFPILNNLWGWIATNDPLYLYTSTIQTGQLYQNAWPKQGFEHYFVMSPVFWGIVSLMLMVLYFFLTSWRLQQQWFVAIPLVLFFLLHCLFNTQSLKIGASTGGNLRYMAVISPLVAVCATLSIDHILSLKKRLNLFYILVSLLIALGIWTTFPDNNVVYSHEARNWTPLLAAIAISAGLFLFRSRKSLGGFLIGASVVLLITTARALPPSPEDLTVKQVAQWETSIRAEEQTILVNHTLFYYWLGKASFQLKHGSGSIDSSSVQQASPGTIILWDSHYSYRPELNPKAVPLEYFTSRPNQFKFLDQFISTDQRFGIIAFQKL